MDSPLSQDYQCEHFSVFYLYMFSLTMFQWVYGQNNFKLILFSVLSSSLVLGEVMGWRVDLGGLGNECDWTALCEISKNSAKILYLKSSKIWHQSDSPKKILNSILWFLLLAGIITFDSKRSKKYKLIAKEVFLLYWMHV